MNRKDEFIEKAMLAAFPIILQEVKRTPGEFDIKEQLQERISEAHTAALELYEFLHEETLTPGKSHFVKQ